MVALHKAGHAAFRSVEFLGAGGRQDEHRCRVVAVENSEVSENLGGVTIEP